MFYNRAGEPMASESVPEKKILVCGDVNGKFRALFRKVEFIIKKQQDFDYLFCVGNFFGPSDKELQDLLAGEINVPIKTYILGPNKEVHHPHYNFENVHNLTCLGKAGIINLDGLRVSYLSGLELTVTEIPGFNDASKVVYFTEEDMQMVVNRTHMFTRSIDILLTSVWPQDVTKYSAISDVNLSSIHQWSSSLVSELAKQLKPRYHFSGLAGIYYEREPFRNDTCMDSPPQTNVTRYFGLGSVHNTENQKWLYAFKIKPMVGLSEDELYAHPESTTPSPYLHEEYLKDQLHAFFASREKVKVALANTRISFKRPRCDESYPGAEDFCIEVCRCWFCFEGIKFQRDLIIALGTYNYVALAKGILVPEHVLIIPIDHVSSTSELPIEASEEILQYKKSLANYFHDKNKDVVFFERAFHSTHTVIQVVPVPKHMKNEIQEALFSEAKAAKLEFVAMPKYSRISQRSKMPSQYFYIEIMVNKDTQAKYLHVSNKKDFPLQFGRAVLANSKVLNVVDRVEWKKCVGSKEAELEMVGNMKRAFLPYDMTEQDINSILNV